MNISTEKKIMDLENRLVADPGEREGVGGIGSLGLSHTTWNEIYNEILLSSIENYV